MRRLAFLVISLALILGVASPMHATPRNQVWTPPGSNERDSGASGDDDLPSKGGSQIAPDIRPSLVPVGDGKANQQVPMLYYSAKRLVARVITTVEGAGRLILQPRR